MSWLDPTLRRVLPWLRWCVLVVAGVAGTVPRLAGYPEWFPAWLQPWIVSHQFWLVALPAAAVVPLEALERWLIRRRRSARLKALLAELLERIRPEFLVQDLREAPAPHHRLTLYKANKRQTKLTIVARSGEATSGSATWWAIHRDEQNRCQGVAGMGWYLSALLVVPDRRAAALPDVAGTPSERELADYAKRTYVTEQDVSKHRWRARSFAAMTIRDGGRRWGVLVFDSVDPDAGRGDFPKKMLSFTPQILTAIIKAWNEP